MFLQQLLRQRAFTIHKIPTRVNPADLNTKKFGLERMKLLSTLCGLYPICSQGDRDEEVLTTRRIQRNVAHRLVQALQVVTIGLLQACSLDLSGITLVANKVFTDMALCRALALLPGLCVPRALCGVRALHGRLASQWWCWLLLPLCRWWCLSVLGGRGRGRNRMARNREDVKKH